PADGKKFAHQMFNAGVDAAILFPQAGPIVLSEWVKALQDRDVGVIVGGEMTHPAYLNKDGGYIKDDAPERMYTYAAVRDVNNFVVPGNKPESITKYRRLVEEKLDEPAVYWSPGLITQGGDVSEAADAAGEFFCAIVGGGVKDPQGRKDYSKVTTEERHESIKALCKNL
ncbi:hypothetical protein ACFL96_18385, partial [Thermoproteota archaeon]